MCLPFPSVSAKHCKLSWRDGWWFIEDLKSSNGTWVNGFRCEKKCLPPQSIVAFSAHRYVIHYKAVGEPPSDQDNVFAQGLLAKLGLSKEESSKLANTPKAKDEIEIEERTFSLAT